MRPANSRLPQRGQGFDDEPEGTGDEWQVTYLDTVTILLAFFIILASLADTDMKTIMGSGKPEEVEAPTPQEASSMLFYPIEDLYGELERTLAQEIAEGAVRLEKGDYEIRMQFSGSSFYALGEAVLLPSGEAIITRIVGELSELERKDFKLDVEGHTDSAPIKTAKFSDNWQLSAARASGVVRYFLQAGIPADKLKASGYADTFREVEDRDEAGNYLPEQQNLNRRIVIRLYYN